MRRLLPTLVLAAAASLTPAALGASGGGSAPTTTGPALPPPPPPKLVVSKPTKKLQIHEGQGGRLLLGGRWYFRQDDAGVGISARYFNQKSLSGWTAIRVPFIWNGADTTQNRQSTGWYRREFKLPKAPKGSHRKWVIRFESVNTRGTVYLNGKEIGGGGPSYLPFELDLKGLKKGRNRLVVRVSNRRGRTDLTHWRVYGGGGWWNFGGLGREVYVRPVDTVDIQDMAVSPTLRKVKGPAKVQVRLRLRSLAKKRRTVRLVLTVGGGKKVKKREIELERNLGGMATREVVTSFTLKKPRLWRPGKAFLYNITAAAQTDGERKSSFFRAFGVRQIRHTRDGRILVNGKTLQLRGAAMHEDDPGTGPALGPGQRKQYLSDISHLHASVVRSHYPLHPAFLEAFDRRGILYWEGMPVYQLPNATLNLPSVRRAARVVTQRAVTRDRSHPSVLVWSVGNELAYQPTERGIVGPGFARYLTDVRGDVRKLDKTRLIGLDRQSRIGDQLYSPAVAQLDVLGINEYFGWYASAPAGRAPSRTNELPAYLNQVHAAYPTTPLMVTEYGAESTGHGPVTARGTFEFQTDYLKQHLAIHARLPYVAGSIIWALKDFRVAPSWTGGNTLARSTPPWNNKGLIDQTGEKKPAYFQMSRIFMRTKPTR